FLAFGQQVGDEPVRMAVRINGTDVQAFEVKAEQSMPATFEVKTRLKGGSARLGVAFLNPYTDPAATDPAKQRRMLYVRGVAVDGPPTAPPPVLPEPHRRLMAREPGLAPREAARAILTRFATRAFRRPVRGEEVERFLKLFDAAQKEGERFERCVRVALEGVL